MELQIGDLIESIRKEGVDAANQEAAKIVDEARKKAEDIVAAANTEARRLRESAQRDSELLKESANAEVKQAVRDAVLSFKSEIQGEYDKILSGEIRTALDDSALVKLIQAALAGEDASKYTAELANVTDGLRSKLASEIENGLEIKPVKNIKAGFRLAATDGSGYFDCSDEEITQMLAPYLKQIKL